MVVRMSRSRAVVRRPAGCGLGCWGGGLVGIVVAWGLGGVLVFGELGFGGAGHLCDFGVSEGFGAFVGVFGGFVVAVGFEEDGEVERAVRVAALLGALVGGLGGGVVALVFEEHPEVGRGGGVSELVGALVGV